MALELFVGAGTITCEYCELMLQNKSYIGLAALGVFFWEHSCRLRDISYRPTVGVNQVTKQLKYCFTSIGTFAAQISSFLTKLDFSELKKTSNDLNKSSFNFLTSFMYVFKGYFETAKTYVNGKGLVYLGSILLATALSMGYKFYKSGTISSSTSNTISYLE